VRVRRKAGAEGTRGRQVCTEPGGLDDIERWLGRHSWQEARLAGWAGTVGARWGRETCHFNLIIETVPNFYCDFLIVL
jgi:hypothetical protein